MAVKELALRTRNGETDGAKSDRQRRWYVDTVPDSALADPGLPAQGTPYPGNPAPNGFPLLLDRFTVETAENGNTYVTGHYTNDRSGRIRPQADSTNPIFKSWSTDWQDTTMSYPMVFTHPIKVPGQPIGSARGSETVTLQVEENLVVYERRIVLTTYTTAMAQAIGRQNKNLHKIDGRLYRFKAARVHQTETNAWETTYTYIEDNGTIEPPGFAYVAGSGMYAGIAPSGPVDRPFFNVGAPSDERLLYIPPAGGNPLFHIDPNLSYPGLYVRAPYHVISFSLRADQSPEWQQTLPGGGKYDPLGWQTLPGDLGF